MANGELRGGCQNTKTLLEAPVAAILIMGFVVNDGVILPQFMGTRQDPALVRDRQIPILHGENWLQDGKNDASDRDLTISWRNTTANLEKSELRADISGWRAKFVPFPIRCSVDDDAKMRIAASVVCLISVWLS